jgi:hypothetical protein
MLSRNILDLKEQVCHDHGIDLFKLEREWDIRRGIEIEEAAGIDFGPFHREFMLRNAPEKVQQILAEMRAGQEICLLNAEQGFASMDYRDFPSANLRAAIASTTTETNLWNPAIHAPLPVGSIRGGKAWQLNFGGVHGTTATPAISFRARCGTDNSAPPTGTDLGVGPTMTLGNFTAQPFVGVGTFGCRSIGVAASGATITGNGFVICAGAAAATTVATCVFGGAIPTTIDDTVAQGLSVSMIWGTSNASNTLTPQWVTHQSMN